MSTDSPNRWEKCSNKGCGFRVHPVFYKRYNGNCSPKCQKITELATLLLKSIGHLEHDYGCDISEEWRAVEEHGTSSGGVDPVCTCGLEKLQAQISEALKEVK